VHGSWAASYLALWALVIVLTAVVVAISRQLGSLSARLGPAGAAANGDGPPLGATPEAVTVLDLGGDPVTVGGPGGPQLLLFVSPGCGACEVFLPALPAIARSGQVTPHVVTAVDPAEAEREFASHVARLISSPQILESYNVVSTPYAVVLDRLGVVKAKGTVGSIEQIETLVEAAHRRPDQPSAKLQTG
jgi:methylamine dehydrogenase accessory protein MauD